MSSDESKNSSASSNSGKDDSDNSSDESTSNKKSNGAPNLQDSSDSSAASSPAASPRPQAANDSDDSDSDKETEAKEKPKEDESDKESKESDMDSDSDKESDKEEKKEDESDGDQRGKTATDKIFGDFNSSDSDEEEKKSEAGEEVTAEELERRNEQMRALSVSSDEDAPRKEIIELNEDLPNVKLNLGKTGPAFVRPPNFLSIESQPFNAESYKEEAEDEEVYDDEGRSRLKLKIENTIRWRWVKDEKTGEYKRQSNAKFVKWSDGTVSMYLGGEIFEVQTQATMPNMHLYTRVGPALQAQATFKQKYTFRPHSTDTATHRKLTLNMADKTNKGSKVKMMNAVGINPEQQRKDMVKKEEESLRAAARRTAQQRRARERNREIGLTSGFIEGDSDEEGNIGAIKRDFKNRAFHGGYYSDDSEEDERSRRVLREAKIIDSDSEEDQPGSSKQRRKHKIVEDDDED